LTEIFAKPVCRPNELFPKTLRVIFFHIKVRFEVGGAARIVVVKGYTGTTPVNSDRQGTIMTDVNQGHQDWRGVEI
jgi:hypothetical protein